MAQPIGLPFQIKTINAILNWLIKRLFRILYNLSLIQMNQLPATCICPPLIENLCFPRYSYWLFKHHFNPKCKHIIFYSACVCVFMMYKARNELTLCAAEWSELFADIAFLLFILNKWNCTHVILVGCMLTICMPINCTPNNLYKYWTVRWYGSVHRRIDTRSTALTWCAINKTNTIPIVFDDDRWFSIVLCTTWYDICIICIYIKCTMHIINCTAYILCTYMHV